MGQKHNNEGAIPVWKRYALTIPEASAYYHIGENKLRMMEMNTQNQILLS